MNILFTSDGQWIKPHINHLLKSFFYTTDIQIAIVNDQNCILDSFPKACFIEKLSREYIEKINTDLKPLIKCKRTTKGTYTYVYEENISFIIAPIYQNHEYKGYFIAGPICLSKQEWQLARTNKVTKHLADDISIKEPPKIFYFSQTLQHLMDKAIYIGPHHSEPNKTFISKEDMKKRTRMNQPFLIMVEISSHVIHQKMHEAIKLYKQSLMFGDLIDEHSLHQHQTLKIHMISLLTLIYERIISRGYHSPYLEHYYDNFSSRISNSHTFQDLFECGECIIKKFSNITEQNLLHKKSKITQDALSYIHTNYDKKITLDSICKHIYVSKTHLSQQFKSEMKVSIINYLKSYRITQGKYLLEHTNLSILDIALETGFENANYFSNVFKSSVKKTPSKYRKEVKGL